MLGESSKKSTMALVADGANRTEKARHRQNRKKSETNKRGCLEAACRVVLVECADEFVEPGYL